jgi:hypothetical protein
MNVGMLWFDNDPRVNLDGKIARAADYYRAKYGRTPTLCFVHPSMLRNGKPGDEAPDSTPPEKSFAACGIEIRSNRSVLPNHFWIGVNGTAV